MSITYNDLISRAEQVRDESEIGANTATRVGQLLADIIQWCKDNNADLGDYLLNFTAHLNESGGILNWFQSRIVLLKTMGSAYDDVSVGSLSDGDVYYDSQGNWIREKQGSATINGIHPSKGVFYVNLANKTVYQWDGTTFQVAIESGGGGGASTVTAFEDYEVVASVGDLPEQGNPTTGYIVGTHIYIYVGEGGDTADGKYQDLGELSVNPDIYQPKLIAGTGIALSGDTISVAEGVRNGAAAGATAVQSVSVNGTEQTKDQNGNVNIQSVAGADGKSAYQLYREAELAAGRTPLELPAWLESLHGADGNDAITGGVGNVTVYNNFNTAPEQGNDINVTGATIGYEMYNDIADHEDRISELEENQEGGVEVSLSGDTLYIVTNPDLPWIRANRSAINYGDTLIGGNGKTVRLAITYKNLTSNIGVAVSGTGFSVVDNTQSIPVSGTGRATAYLDIKFQPASGTTDGTKSGTLTLTSGNNVSAVVNLSGNALSEVTPTLSIEPTTLSLKAMDGQTDSATLRIQGSNLEAAVSLAVTGSGLALTLNGSAISQLSPNANGEVNEMITVTYTADTATGDVNGTVTASSTGVADATADITCQVSELPSGYERVNAVVGKRLNTGYTILEAGNTTYDSFKCEVHTSNKANGASTHKIFGTSGTQERQIAIFGTGGQGNLAYFGYKSSAAVTRGVGGVGSGDTTDTDGLYKYEFGIDSSDNAYIKNLVNNNVTTGSSGTTRYYDGDRALWILSDNDNVGIGVFKVWSYGVLKLNLVACKRISDDAYGFYDKVSGTFKTVTGLTLAS